MDRSQVLGVPGAGEAPGSGVVVPLCALSSWPALSRNDGLCASSRWSHFVTNKHQLRGELMRNHSLADRGAETRRFESG